VTDLLTRTIATITPLDADAMRAAEARQMQLTKPPKALGRLETLSIQLAGIQGKAQPVIESKAIAVMALLSMPRSRPAWCSTSSPAARPSM
jgi:nicotinate-nucleotide--dimethylbenzimidazole phosphoribosyltransferase